MSQSVLEHVEAPVTQTDGGSPRYSHIVWPKSILVDAMLTGSPVTALCGHTWVPGRDPRKYPVCTRCVEAFEQLGHHFTDRGDFE